MGKVHYERSTAMDTSFLVLEEPWSPLHVSATPIYEADPLATGDGGIDIEAAFEEIATAAGLEVASVVGLQSRKGA